MSTPKRPPEILYKYFPPERHPFFLKPLLRFAPFKSLNDPFEGQLVYGGYFAPNAFANDKKSVINLFHDMFFMNDKVGKRKHDDEEILEWGMEFNDCSIDKLNSYYNSYKDKIDLGILSLSEVYDNELMWAHYSKSHTGFVVGFNSSHSFFSKCNDDYEYFGVRRVRYYRKRQKQYAANNSVDFMVNFFSKSYNWRYEKEWRVIQSGISKLNEYGVIGLVEVDYTAIKSIYLGLNVDSQVEALARKFSAEHDGVLLKKANLHPSQYTIEFIDI